MSQEPARVVEALGGLGFLPVEAHEDADANGAARFALSADDYPALKRAVERSLRAEKELPRHTLRAIGRSLEDAQDALFPGGAPFTVALGQARDGVLVPHLQRLSRAQAGGRVALCQPGLEGVLQMRPDAPVHLAEPGAVARQPEMLAWRVVESAANRGNEAYLFGEGGEEVGRKGGLAHLRRGLEALGFEVGGPVRRWQGDGLPAARDAPPVVFEVGATLSDAGALRRGLEANPRMLQGLPVELDAAFMEEDARVYIRENGRLDLYFMVPEGPDLWAPLHAASACPVFERVVLTPPGAPWGGVVGDGLVAPLARTGRQLTYLLFLLTQGLPWFRYWEAGT